jgi:hypothetical protein
VAAGCDGQLAGDGREYTLDLVAQGNQDGDGDHGNEGENQGVLHESLALLALHPAQRDFGASNYFVDHCFFTSLLIKIVQKFCRAVPVVRLLLNPGDKSIEKSKRDLREWNCSNLRANVRN